MKDPTSFEEFWPGYLDAHADSRTRALHLGGSAAALACGALFFATGMPGWALAALVTGYGAAWIGHALFERNMPKTFSHPLWSIRGDFRMMRLALTGRLDAEMAALRAAAAAKSPAEGT